MIEHSEPQAILVEMERILADLDRLGADIVAARMSEVIDAFRNRFNMNGF